jgi:hypothetical protein
LIPDHRNYYNRAITHLTVQDHDHAIADRTTSLNPNDADALMRRDNSDYVKLTMIAPLRI